MKFKDYFDRRAARALAAQISDVHPSFDRDGFVRRATRGLSALEFSGRVSQFSRALRETLPDAAGDAIQILTASLPAEFSDCEAVTDGWLQWPVGQFIADHGLDDFEVSMVAMVELTKRFSSEFAVRPFVEHHPAETFDRLRALTSDPNPHVRRWCSEGVRPRLPWGRRLTALVRDPAPIWPILEALRDDPEPYVQRSVANNLNDIAKDHPDAVVARCRRWMRGAGASRAWIVKHGLRSLVKSGHAEALALLGFGSGEGIHGELRLHPPRPWVGDALELQLSLRSSQPAEVQAVVDYRVEFARPAGRASSRVFKWTTARLSASEGRVELRKRHPLRHTTTRMLHPGPHRVSVLVNGAVVATGTFDLVATREPRSSQHPERP